MTVADGVEQGAEAKVTKMMATVFYGKDDIRVEEVERPRAGVNDAVIRVTLTTICGTHYPHGKGRAGSETRRNCRAKRNYAA
jgi:hypothetical protein